MRFVDICSEEKQNREDINDVILMCQPEHYWMSKQRVLLFKRLAHLNNKRMFVKRYLPHRRDDREENVLFFKNACQFHECVIFFYANYIHAITTNVPFRKLMQNLRHVSLIFSTNGEYCSDDENS